MNVLFANKFLYPRGGAEVSMFETARLLEKKGHRVAYFSMDHPSNIESEFSRFFVSNVDYAGKISFAGRLKAAGRLLYSFEAKRMVSKLLDEYPVDIVHLNNIAHQLSPSIIDEFKRRGLPVVMSLRDYKLVCPSYAMLSNGRVCEDCKGGRFYRAAINRCHKGSFANSLLVASEMTLHRLMRIYREVDVFIATSRFLKSKLEEMGFVGDIAILPNIVDLDDYREPAPFRDGPPAAIYFGRLSHEKGLITLCEAFKGIELELHIVGDGPQKNELLEKIKSEKISNIRIFSHLEKPALIGKISEAMFAILPSEWYEAFGRTALEAFAAGRPVVGARIGGIPELVRDNETGLLFEPGNAKDLREKILMLASDRALVERLGRNARALVEAEFNHEVHYKGLIAIYEDAIKKNKMKRA